MNGESMEEDGAGRARDGAIDLPQLFRAIARRKWWIIIPTCAAFALALAVVILVPPRYTGVAKVLLENQESYYTRPDKAAVEQAPTLDPEAVQSQAETITSPDLARKAIAKLDLMDRAEFNQAAATDPLVVRSIDAWLRRPGLLLKSADARIVETFLSRLTAFPVAKTRVLQIEFVSRDPELAARGANVVAQLFLEGQESAKKNEAKAASAWLASKIDELRGKVAETDAKVENYRAQSGLLAGNNNMTVPGQQLADLNTQLAAARSAQSAALAKAQLLRTMLHDGRLNDVPELAKDESLRRYAEQRVTLKAQIAQESRTLLPGHPRMKELAAQLKASTARYASPPRKPRAASKTTPASPLRKSRASTARWRPSPRPSRPAMSTRSSCTRWSSTPTPPATSSNPMSKNTARRSHVTPTMPRPRTRASFRSPAPPRTPTFPKKVETLALGTLAGLILSTGVVISQALLSGAPAPSLVETSPVVVHRREEDAAVEPALLAGARR